ncbi:nucleotidyltransferase family protein [Burkholderia pseudomallei]|uniref:hypothetical protein n=1 Tax=Burkholderia pseudomallei TaxID=28450 RepID=UPI00052AC1C6|nr:hypothetical protein [Burkholderia pseudomallei]AIV90107.1 hypothetical protein X995_1190 [Burkholderia pseudomallei B03]AIV95648.1 hypothetical protein X996_1141 [Burkholderia pseudomallei A79A]KGY05442.1 hypothetical protein Y023_324 [Burkholderia pseudomallei A79D]KGY06440.1 hypothetical protein X997_319 [Burkholderia pseudomallei A79C]
MKYPSHEVRMPREQATKLLVRICARLDACSTAELDKPVIPGMDAPGLTTATRLWVVGSYARGALTCGDLDLVMQVDKPFVPVSQLNRALLANPQRVSLYTGTPEQNTSLGPFKEAVLVWELGKDWQAALDGIQTDESVLRFARPTDRIPFRREQIGGDLTWAEEMLGLHERNELAWRFVPLDEVSDLLDDEPQSPEEHEFFRIAQGSRVGGGTKKLLPYVLAFIRRFGPVGRPWSMDTGTQLEYGGTRFFLGVPPAPDELMDLSCSQLVVMAHLNTRGPNGFWVIERGPSHPYLTAFEGCEAWVIADAHGAPVVMQATSGLTAARPVASLDIFLSRADAEQFVEDWNEDVPPEPGEARDVKVVRDAAWLDVLTRCDLLTGGLPETVFSADGWNRACKAGFESSSLTRCTAEELASVLRPSPAARSRNALP